MRLSCVAWESGTLERNDLRTKTVQERPYQYRSIFSKRLRLFKEEITLYFDNGGEIL